jgi:hypothetical protein
VSLVFSEKPIRSFRSESPEKSFIRIKEDYESGDIRAFFCMELAGVSGREKLCTCMNKECECERRKSGRYWKETVIGGLKEKQRLELIYTGGRSIDGRKHLNWKILCSAGGDSVDEAVESARKLWDCLQVANENISTEYHFIPVSIDESYFDSAIRGKYNYRVQPLGIRIPAEDSSIGFSVHADEGRNQLRSVLLPDSIVENKYDRFDSFASGVQGCTGPVELIVSISPRKLSDDQIQSLSSALKWLQDTGCKQIRYLLPDDSNILVNDQSLFKYLENQLLLWLKNPQGYRISCNVFSSSPLPSSFLAIIGKELFQGCKMEVFRFDEIEDEISKMCDYQKLDLRSSFNSNKIETPLFPGMSLLREAGVKKIYSLKNPDISQSGILLGKVSAGCYETNVRIPQSDRSRHMYILGATGTGKSTLLYNMIKQDIENGEGVVLIDPHGDLYKQVLNSIPERRLDDVVLINPCDFERSVGINFLEQDGQFKHVQMNFVVNEMIKIFDRLYDLRETGGPMFEQYMRNALFLTMDNELPGATLMDIPMIFEDGCYRRYLILNCRNPFVKSFWSKQAEEAGGEASLRNMAPYITSKLNQFTSNALIRPIIGQTKSTINFREIMDEGQILIVNLSKGYLGELDTQLLGMLIIGKIFSAAMSRINIPEDVRRPLFLYVDEFQNFTTDTVVHLLSEARKFGIHLILANQNLSQLSTNRGSQNIMDSVLGNIGNMLVFRLGYRDAEKMQTYTKPELLAEDLQELPNYHVAGRLLIHNAPGKPFVFNTLPMPNIRTKSNIARIVNTNMMKYSKPTKEVEDEIIKRRTLYGKITQKEIIA